MFCSRGVGKQAVVSPDSGISEIKGNKLLIHTDIDTCKMEILKDILE